MFSVIIKRVYREDPPQGNNINRWEKQLMETGTLLDQKRSGGTSVSDESVEATDPIKTRYVRAP